MNLEGKNKAVSVETGEGGKLDWNIQGVSIRPLRSAGATPIDLNRQNPLQSRNQLPKMQIFVKTLTGKSMAMDVDLATQTVHDVKKHVEKVEGIMPSMQRLIYCGKQLEDGVRLADYNVPNSGTLHLVIRLQGGH